MDNVEMVDRTCVVCGKVFQEVKHPKGNRRKFCSHECELAHRREYRREYFRKRYKQDDEYREKTKILNAQRLIEKRKVDKAEAIRDAAIDLYNAETLDDIINILNEKFNMKAEVYDKYAHSLRVPKESR